MLEFLFLAFFSVNSEHFWGHIEQDVQPLPQISILNPAKVPLKKETKIAPKFLENPKLAILAYDTKAGKTLFEKNNNRVQPIASLTKILSALIILEENHINDIVTVPLEATKISGSKIDIYQYEKITVETLLKSVLIASANDSMVALAIHNAESEQKFVRKMNEKAKKMGLTSAKFYNSTGLDLYNPDTDEMYGNTMSANDLLTLTRIALKNDFLRETVKKDTFWGTSVNEEFAHEKTSTNQLLGTFVNSKGVKTGYTKLAGECLINLIQSEDNKEIITIILGSKDRFGETKNLVAWILDSFVWK